MAKTKAEKDERRRQRKIQQLRESESRWWQKVLFDLAKARAARDSLAEAKGDKEDSMMVIEDGPSIDLDEVARVIDGRVNELADAMGKGAYGRRKS